MQVSLREQAKAMHRAKEEDLSRENRGFVQVYPQGWKRIRELMSENPTAARVYAVLAEHIDPSCGAVVVSQDVLAEIVGVSERTIRRATTYLESKLALVRIRVGGSVYAYALNPSEVWKAWDCKKEHSAFVTRTLVKRSDRENGTVKRRLQMMLREERGEPELDLEEGYDPETGEVRDGSLPS